jgi:hypothetical protein
MNRLLILATLLFFAPWLLATAQDTAPMDKAAYVHAVTRGAGMMPGQAPYPSPEETAFRETMEARKDALLTHSARVRHPVLYTEDELNRARANVESSEWARGWRDNQVALADFVLKQPAGWIETMIPLESPAHGYGFTCPKCVGDKSQEAVGYSLASWSHEVPEQLACTACGQTYPHPDFPETAELIMPRMGHRITYYLNEAERANPDDRSGELAWHWVGYPIHVSFTGLIRERKIGFMRDAAQSLAFAYAFTGDTRYAEAARDVLIRYAEGYRNWLYRDYWDTYADCDPLFAAWHDKALPLYWKRHLSEEAYAKDTLERAGMRQNYWGAGRVHPSTDSISGVPALAMAYDLTCAAEYEDGTPVWTPAQRAQVERDLLVEYILGAEPYVGGPNKAENANNKAPRIYSAMAFVAKSLGIPAMADTALRGYEKVRDESFNADGFCTESPSYNNMYLGPLLHVPETLHGFVWPEDFTTRTGTVDYYASDDKLRRMYRAVLWTLLPSGQYLPLSDTHVHTRPSSGIVHLGMRRYPELFAGTAPLLGADSMEQYTLFHLSEEALQETGTLELPETVFPDWGTAILRHEDATLTLAFNPWGGHRHYDNLALFYDTGGRSALGDLGYVGDMPMNNWIKSTLSHNLVVVDGKLQEGNDRQPQFHLMAASPLASVVEASSTAYAQCIDYRRRVVMVKGPGSASFAVDIFHVAGGSHHAFRTYSEIAASDAKNGAITFDGVDMPPEPPLPEVGASLEREDIHGLRDVRSAKATGDAWQATWREEDAAYRLWMLSPCDRVEASNGPGQRDLREAGRRVRYVDAVREGDVLASTFVAVHEPSDNAGNFLIRDAVPIAVEHAGPHAVALRVETDFGQFFVFNTFDQAATVAGIRFQGKFALLKFEERNLVGWFTVGAHVLKAPGVDFEDANAMRTAALKAEGDTLVAEEVHAWPQIDQAATAWAQVRTPEGRMGYRVEKLDETGFETGDYPLPPEVHAATIHAVRYQGIK